MYFLHDFFYHWLMRSLTMDLHGTEEIFQVTKSIINFNWHYGRRQEFESIKAGRKKQQNQTT